MLLKKLLISPLLCVGLTACFDSDDDDDPAPAASVSVEDSLDAAVAYMDESLPEYGSAGTVAYMASDVQRALLAGAKTLSPISTAHAVAAPVSGTANLAAHWETTTATELVSPVGGFPGSAENYPGTTTQVARVEVKEYIGQQLDGSFTRFSGDDTPRPYKPTLFGRFENSLEIVRIFGEVFPNGLAVGTEQVSVQEDPDTGDVVVAAAGAANTMDISLEIVDISSQSTTYDWAIYVDMGEEGNWMWVKNTTEALNFQHLESKSTSENSVTFNRISLSTLRWNRTSGEMGFEYVSFDDDTNTQAYGNVMRAYIDGTGGDGYMLSFEGDSSGDATRDTHQAFSLATTGGDDATEALVSVNMDITNSGGNDLEVNGSVCASMANGDELTDAGSCGSLSLGSLDLSTSFPTVVNNLLGATTVASMLSDAGVATWTDTAAPDLGTTLQFTDETDMHSGYSGVQ
jgi:hypothetical protein